MSRAAFIFRRDLRLEDNLGLLQALEEHDEVVCVFIFDTAQRDHKYFSKNAFQFMLKSLEELDEALQNRGSRLHIVEGKPADVCAELVEKGVSAVYVNEDYTPFSKERDARMRKATRGAGAEFVSCFDLCLSKPGTVLTNSDSPYTVYTPFWKKASQHQVPRPRKNNFDSYGEVELSSGTTLSAIREKLLPQENDELFVKGGRSEALAMLRGIDQYDKYLDERNFPAIRGTTGLSAHHKFGTISIRESFYAVYDALGASSHLLKELYWRDFYMHIAHFFPRVFGKEFIKKYADVKWDYDKEKFAAWCEGRTGYPIVDAGMRQLTTTGWMHNRVRMIVASFLTKHLHIDWRWGEEFFAQHLVDYDPAVNNGSWQWAASTGCDAQPYFRIFNPWSQQEKFDKDCEYIKKWVPELEGLDPKAIHNIGEQRPLGDLDYPPPIVEHKPEREEALRRFKEIK